MATLTSSAQLRPCVARKMRFSQQDMARATDWLKLMEHTTDYL